MKISKRFLYLLILPFLIAATFLVPAQTANIDLGPAIHKATKHLDKTDSAKFTDKELHCLSKAVYYEARGEPLLGKAAVAWVILNRVSFGFAPSICEVVHQGKGTYTCQFSFVCMKNLPPINTTVYEVCKKVAHDVLVKKMYANVVPGAVNFHSMEIDPGWTNLTLIRQIGTQLFYKR
jgi:Cell Wall Hydrolase